MMEFIDTTHSELVRYKEKTLDEFQSKLVNIVLHSDKNAIGEAVAGSGKTFTEEAALSLLSEEIKRKTFVCAFTNRDEATLQGRLPNFPGEILNTHKTGLRLISRKFGRVQIDPKKDWEYSVKEIENSGREEGAEEVKRAVVLGKALLSESAEDIENICFQFGIGDNEFPQEEIASLAWQAIKKSTEEVKRVSLDDMIYFPWAHNIALHDKELVVGDEIQDWSPAQIWLVASRVAKGGRFIGVGDRKQGVYSWRGADKNAIPNIQKQFNAVVQPLSISYRCPKAVESLLKGFYEDWQFLVPEWAKEGRINNGMPLEEAIENHKLGDLWMSRTNAPLASICFAFLKRGIPANIVGKDITKGLKALIKKSKAGTTKELMKFLAEYEAQEIDRLNSLGRDVSKSIEAVQDKVELLIALGESTHNVSEIISNMDEIFYEPDEKPQEQKGRGRPKKIKKPHVILSTVHKQKGGEAERVFMVSKTFRPDRGEEEKNIYYVATTRTKNELSCVDVD